MGSEMCIRDSDSLALPASYYSTWLLPAAAIGAIGLVPVVLLTAKADYSFQAKTAFVLAGLVIVAVLLAAWSGNLIRITQAFFLYHLAATALLWFRSIGSPGLKSAV